jgi:hypothetical protein
LAQKPCQSRFASSYRKGDATSVLFLNSSDGGKVRSSSR